MSRSSEGWSGFGCEIENHPVLSCRALHNCCSVGLEREFFLCDWALRGSGAGRGGRNGGDLLYPHVHLDGGACRDSSVHHRGDTVHPRPREGRWTLRRRLVAGAAGGEGVSPAPPDGAGRGRGVGVQHHDWTD